MRASTGWTRSLVLAALMVGAADARHAAAVALPAVRHARLVKSQPADGDTLRASPDSIRLWFSEDVQLPVTHVRVTRPGHTPHVGMPVITTSGGGQRVVVAVEDKLSAGAYKVVWKTAGPDGHPATGTYSFVVKPGR